MPTREGVRSSKDRERERGAESEAANHKVFGGTGHATQHVRPISSHTHDIVCIERKGERARDTQADTEREGKKERGRDGFTTISMFSSKSITFSFSKQTDRLSFFPCFPERENAQSVHCNRYPLSTQYLGSQGRERESASRSVSRINLALFSCVSSSLCNSSSCSW